MRNNRSRNKEDRLLTTMERKIDRAYSDSFALFSAKKELAEYMKYVSKQTKSEYEAYVKEADPDKKKELKKKYGDAVFALTAGSKAYKRIVDKLASVLSDVAQEAIDIANETAVDAYVIGHNEIEKECKAVGIKVNG